MITIGILACAAVVWRIRRRLFTRAEAALAALIVVNWVMIWAQINVADRVPFPEQRYWIQSFVLLGGWAVWGVDRAAAALSGRFPAARFVLPILIGALALFDLVMVFKPHIPVGRRYAYAQACTWAEGVIRDDWRGPAKDEKNPFSIREYHRPNRPVVRAFSRRLPYVLGGRRDNPAIFGPIDTPDYIVVDTRKGKAPSGARYEKIASNTFARRTFDLYRLKKKGVKRTFKPSVQK